LSQASSPGDFLVRNINSRGTAFRLANYSCCKIKSLVGEGAVVGRAQGDCSRVRREWKESKECYLREEKTSRPGW